MELGLEEVEVEEIEMALPSRDEVEDEERRLRFLDIVVICQLSGSGIWSGTTKSVECAKKNLLEAFLLFVDQQTRRSASSTFNKNGTQSDRSDN